MAISTLPMPATHRSQAHDLAPCWHHFCWHQPLAGIMPCSADLLMVALFTIGRATIVSGAGGFWDRVTSGGGGGGTFKEASVWR